MFFVIFIVKHSLLHRIVYFEVKTDKNCINLPGSYVCRDEYIYKNSEKMGSRSKIPENVSGKSAKNSEKLRLHARLRNIIAKRMTSPSGRCISTNLEISDLREIQWSKNLAEIRKSLLSRIEKMYFFCHANKGEKVKMTIKKIIRRLGMIEKS